MIFICKSTNLFTNAYVYTSEQQKHYAMKKSIVLIALLGIALVGCKKKENIQNDSPTPHNQNQTETEQRLGLISGKVVSTNGVYPIKQANVYIDVNAHLYITQTDENGEFILEAPLGDHQLIVATGDGQKFRTALNTTISENNQTPKAVGNIQLNQVAQIAYVYGEYDDIQTIIRDSLGYSISELQLSDLSNLSLMSTYDAIFLNCGHGYGYLTGNDDGDYLKLSSNHEVELDAAIARSSCAPRLGGFLPPSVLCSDKIGVSGVLASNTIVTPVIQGLLGKPSLDIYYDLDSWEVISQLGSEFNVLIEDPMYGNGPLAIRSNTQLLPLIGGPSVGYVDTTGTFVAICTEDPFGNQLTLSVPVATLPAHLAAGASLGPCEGVGGIVYTTFHNHHQTSNNQDVRDILDWVILNL